jgi:acyl-CoA thioesterase
VPPSPSTFERATAVEPLGDGRFRAAIDTGWSAPMGPNGGYVAAIVVRALQAAIDPGGERRLRSLTCHYLRPPVAGEALLAVEAVRRGRRFSTGRVSLIQGGRECVAAIAALATPGLESAGEWAPRPPAVAGPPARDAGRTPFERYCLAEDAWLEPAEGMAEIARRVQLAPRLGAAPFSGTPLGEGEAAVSGGWMTLPAPARVDAPLVALLTDLWWPPSLQPLTTPSGVPTIDLTIHVRADLGPEGLADQPVLGVFRSAAALGGLVEEDGELYLADGTLLAQSRQLALLAPMGSGTPGTP